jgi:hypothetical protein
VVVGTVEASVVSVAEEVGGAVALADLVAGSVDSAGGFGGRSIRPARNSKRFEMTRNQKEWEYGAMRIYPKAVPFRDVSMGRPVRVSPGFPLKACGNDGL